jgi:hypothetical protein
MALLFSSLSEGNRNVGPLPLMQVKRMTFRICHTKIGSLGVSKVSSMEHRFI